MTVTTDERNPAPPDEAVTPPPTGNDSRSRGKQSIKFESPRWLLVPGLALLGIVIVVPLGIAFWISTLDLDQYTLRSWLSSPFIGVGNYVDALLETRVLHSIWISLSSSILITVITLPIGLVAALTVHNTMKARGIIRALYLIPYIMPAFVAATIWRTLLQPDGAVNNLLGTVGIDGGYWLIGDRAYVTLVLVAVWTSWPFIYLLTLAALQGIPMEVYEAAVIDGAGYFKKLRYIVIPQLKGSLALALLVALLSHLNSFTIPYVLFGNPAPDAVAVLPMLTYSTSFASFRFGLGSAMAIFSLVLIAIPLFVYVRAVKLDSGESEGKK